MAKFTLSQLAHLVYLCSPHPPSPPPPPPPSPPPAPPNLTIAPVVASVVAGNPVFYAAGTGITGYPSPTIQFDLWKNGSLFTLNYVSGAYTAPTAGDTYQVIETLTNSQGTFTSPSNIVTTQAATSGASTFSQQTPVAAPIGPAYFYTYQANNSPTLYRLNSGSLPAGYGINPSLGVLSCNRENFPTPGTYTYDVAVTNAASIVTISSPQTLVVDYMPTVIGLPVIGVPTRFTVPGYWDAVQGQSGVFDSVQWYSTDTSGSGPQIIAGATGLTYTPASGDVGKYLSVRVVISGKPYASAEFTIPGQRISGTPVQQTTTALLAARGTGGVSSYSAGMTLNVQGVVRYASGSGFYTDNVLSPGVYTAADTDFGSVTNLTASGGVKSTPTMYMTGIPAVVQGQADTAPATASRPAYSTGTGFFVTNGALYDFNGNKFRIRGMNQGHYDSGGSGRWNSKANAIRVFFNPNEGWLTPKITGQALKPVFQDMVTNHVIPIPTIPYYTINFGATVSGNTLTIALDSDVTTEGFLPVTDGNVVVPMTPVTSIPTLLVPYLQSYGASTVGRAGTYTLRHPGYTSATTMFTGTSSAAGTACKFTATINGTNVMNVTAMDAANTAQISVGDYIWIGGKTCAQVASFGTSIGGPGTVNLAINVNIPTKTNFTTGTLVSSGATNPSIIIAFARTYAAQFASRWTQFENYQIINIANEWGPTVAAGGTTWRDSAITAIGIMRTAGFGGTILIDAPGSGQDGPAAATIRQYAGDIIDADPQQNIMIGHHIYGSWTPGSMAGLCANLASVRASRGVPFALSEFGPDNIITTLGNRTLVDPREVMGACEAFNLHWLAWAWDDAAADNDIAKALPCTSGTQTSALAGCSFTANLDTVSGLMTVTAVNGANTRGIAIGDYIWQNNSLCALVQSMGTSSGGIGTINCQVIGNITGSSNQNFAMCKNAGGFAGNGYATSNPNELTRFGKMVVLDPYYGLRAIATPASVV